MAHVRLAYTAIVVGIAGACTAEHVVAPTVVPAFAELRDAPVVAALDGVAVRLEAFAWRDFMPPAPPDGKRLIVVVRIKSTNGAVIPATLTVDGLWLVNGEVAWATSVREEQPRGPDLSVFEAVARDGPKWGPGLTVDVVVRLRGASGQRTLVQVRGQVIQRTE
jgi:hypothetical protein